MAERPASADDGERGSAVVDFVMVSILIVMLLLAVLQVAVYVHVGNIGATPCLCQAPGVTPVHVQRSLGA